MSNAVAKLPSEGQKAPTFTLLSDEGQKVRLADLKGSAVVLYFYPKDATPGCTTEAIEFRDTMASIRHHGAEVFGISPDSVESHCKFIDKQDLNFSLLADTDHNVAEKYGVWTEKNMYGRKYWGVQRATFLIDPDGKVAKVWPKVKPEGHAREVLAAVKEMAE